MSTPTGGSGATGGSRNVTREELLRLRDPAERSRFLLATTASIVTGGLIVVLLVKAFEREQIA
jgi:hypothetical protein